MRIRISGDPAVLSHLDHAMIETTCSLDRAGHRARQGGTG
jgi:hypothetical protein